MVVHRHRAGLSIRFSTGCSERSRHSIGDEIHCGQAWKSSPRIQSPYPWAYRTWSPFPIGLSDSVGSSRRCGRDAKAHLQSRRRWNLRRMGQSM
ncbi:hypothetical protein, partial [Richelia intracellularis]|uniref:hypothetical protein n=1 Tax=Richelia intracellularis TaxID=1164990 RepID=UPI0012DD1DB7